MLTHIPYFETLASIEDEARPEWQPTLAGLVVLRLVDDWLDLGAQVVTTDVSGLRAVRGAVAAISEGEPVRSVLSSLVDTLEQAETATIRAISSLMFAYGKALAYGDQWQLAEDVFTTIRDRAELAAEYQDLAEANLQIAYILRRSGNLVTADEAYLSAIRAAEAVGDVEYHLRGQAGRVGLIIERGDLPTADAKLDKLIYEAQTHGLSELQGRMLHERATLFHMRGNINAAIRFAYQALEHSKDPEARDRILAQIAISFAELGHLQASRDANLILASTAQHQDVRWIALVNLMYVAILEEHELAFEHYRSSLEQAPLPPKFEAPYRLDVAKGLFKFGRHALAQIELSKARQLAEDHAMNQLIFEIDNVTSEQTASSRPRVETQAWSDDIAAIASKIGEWRQLQDTISTQMTGGAA